MNESHRILRGLDHGKRQEAGPDDLDSVALDLHRFAQRGFGEIDVMVIKIPILTVEEFHIGADCHETAAGFETAESMAQRETEMRFAGKMLEKIARENGVERVGGNGQGAEQSWCRKRTSGLSRDPASGLRSIADFDAAVMLLMNSP